MNADKTLYVIGFGCQHEALNQDHHAFAFIGVHRRSSAVDSLFRFPAETAMKAT
jgi:hypothetical protein